MKIQNSHVSCMNTEDGVKKYNMVYMVYVIVLGRLLNVFDAALLLVYHRMAPLMCPL